MNTDQGTCSRCHDKMAEGYFENGHFVRQPNKAKLRKLCDECPDIVAPVCAQCGEELEMQAEMLKMRVLLLPKTLLSVLATALYISVSFAVAALFRFFGHLTRTNSIVYSLLVVSWFYLFALSDIWHPNPLSVTRRMYERLLRKQRETNGNPDA